MSEPVLLDTHDGVATVTLNRPHRLNAITGALLDALLGTLRSLAADEAVRVVVLTGAGRGFCAGGDLHDLAGSSPATAPDARPTPPTTPSPAPPAPPAHSLRELMEVDELLHGMPKPTIAAVNGPCAGAGLSFAAACDVRYAATSAVFVTAFLDVGMPGDHGGIWTVTRAVGPAKARELFLLDERVDAEEAVRIGLVHRALPDGELAGAVARAAARLAAAPPPVVAAMKANLNDALDLGLSRYLDHETERFASISARPDARALARAFVERPRT